MSKRNEFIMRRVSQQPSRPGRIEAANFRARAGRVAKLKIGHADLLPFPLRPRRALGVGVSRDGDPVGCDSSHECRS